LRCEDAVLLTTLDPGISVSDADADALLTTKDRADIDFGAFFDNRIAWVAREEVRSLALENFRNELRAVHEKAPYLKAIRIWDGTFSSSR
jgi:hypothetical protein